MRYNFLVKEAPMAEVKIDRDEDFEKAMRNFKVQCKREGIVRKCRERQFYMKPSQKRRMRDKKKRR
jgi:ribosomal protein S21